MEFYYVFCNKVNRFICYNHGFSKTIITAICFFSKTDAENHVMRLIEVCKKKDKGFTDTYFDSVVLNQEEALMMEVMIQ